MSESQKKQAELTALRLLAASPKTRLQLSQKLLSKGYPRTVVEETLGRLEEQGLLNDRAFAKDLIAKWVHVKPSGIRKISFELKRRGISAKVREELLAELSPEAEGGRARELARAQWEAWSRLPEERRRKKVYDFLARRGFDFEVVRNLIEELEAGGKRQEAGGRAEYVD